MKRFVWMLCLAILLGLFAGCQTGPVGTQPSGGLATTGATAPPVTEPVDIRPLPPENPGNSLIDYDPDRQIYIGSENVYMDYYVGASGLGNFSFEIYSRQKLDPEKISVTFPVDLPFEVRVYEEAAARRPDVSLYNFTDMYAPHLTFPYYLYLAYRGETFEKGLDTSVVDLRGGFYELEDEDGNWVPVADVLAGLYELKEGVEIEPRYLDYVSLKKEDLPEFYVYTVYVMLVNITELQETVVLDKLDLTVGDQTQEIKLGCVRLLPKEAVPTDAQKVYPRTVTCNTCQLYNEGVFELIGVFDIDNAQEEFTIHSLRILEEATQILDITVHLTSGGQSLEMKWDGTSPLYLFKGDSITIKAIVKNEHAEKLMSFVACNAVIEYSNSVGEKFCYVSTQICHERNPYEYYAIIFDGLDMEPYYRNFIYRCTSHEWLNEYRGK